MLGCCSICGKPKVVNIRRGKPITNRCLTCANGMPEKRAIMSKAHKGIPQPREFVEKRAEAIRQSYINRPELREKMSKITKGRIVSKETRRKMSLVNKGQKPTVKCKTAQKKRMKILHSDKQWVKKQGGKIQQGLANMSPKAEAKRRQKISKATKERWADLEYKEKTVAASLKARSHRPTKPEIKLDELLQEHFPKQWIYNGDFDANVIIGGLVPDFVNVNGKKQVIEMFGDYFHNPDLFQYVTYLRTEEGRIERFREFGFDCLIIWEKELKNPNKVLRKLKVFASK